MNILIICEISMGHGLFEIDGTYLVYLLWYFFFYFFFHLFRSALVWRENDAIAQWIDKLYQCLELMITEKTLDWIYI